MTARQPFTRLCQTLGGPRRPARADLHVHTTASDGLYAPSEVVRLAIRAGLAAIAVTDHDTLAGVAPAQEAAAGTSLEVIGGVEITADWRGRELHLLGHFVEPGNEPLEAALALLQADRAQRFEKMIERLSDMGVSLPVAERNGSESLGRRHLAELLVAQRKVATVHEAFRRYLSDEGQVNVPKRRLPVADAVSLVRQAGGVTSWAHPGEEATAESLVELRRLGLQAIEASFPSAKTSREKQLRAWASELGLLVTAGSDCHGPGPRALGACSVTDEELAALRDLAV